MMVMQVGNRRDKVAKASKALWNLMDGDENSDDERESVRYHRCHDVTRKIFYVMGRMERWIDQ